MSLFDDAAELVRTGTVYLVDTVTGEYRDFPASAYMVIDDLAKSGRFVPRLSLAAAMEMSERIKAQRGGKN